MAAPGRLDKWVDDDSVELFNKVMERLHPSSPHHRGTITPYHDDYLHTYREIGRELGVTHERARQIETRALLKCRVWCERNGYRLEDLLRNT